ncbi:hypothetical protein [Streptomyces sp. NPDC001076]
MPQARTTEHPTPFIDVVAPESAMARTHDRNARPSALPREAGGEVVTVIDAEPGPGRGGGHRTSFSVGAPSP